VSPRRRPRKRDPAKDFTQTNGFIVLIFVGVAAVMGLTGSGSASA